MADTANFTNPQFVDATGTGGLNPAFGAVSGAIANTGSGTFSVPGLIAPEAMGVSFAGLNATVTLPLPWGLVASSGVVVRAHGVLTGTDTQSYAVPFSGVVPGTGSVTAYLVATPSTIQQNPVPLPGPPPGHPSWDPNYAPSFGYATLQDTVTLTAVTAPPDNVSAFELLRTVMTAGQSTVATWSTTGQQRAGGRKAIPVTVAGAGALTPGAGQYMLVPSSSGITSTLPLSTNSGGLVLSFTNTNVGTWTIVTSGSDSIFGISSPPGNSSSFSLAPSGSASLWADGQGRWQLIATSQSATIPVIVVITSSQTFTVPAGVYWIKIKLYGGGGSGAYNTTGFSSGAGGEGANSEGIYPVIPGNTYTVVIGIGGVAPTSSGGPGVAGGDSSFVGSGINIVAGGGQGGQAGSGSANAGGAGGIATGGQINTPGSFGGDGTQTGISPGGPGGCGAGQGAGRGSSGFNTGVSATGTFGASGGGGGPNATGGGGAPGCAIIEYVKPI